MIAASILDKHHEYHQHGNASDSDAYVGIGFCHRPYFSRTPNQWNIITFIYGFGNTSAYSRVCQKKHHSSNDELIHPRPTSNASHAAAQQQPNNFSKKILPIIIVLILLLIIIIIVAFLW
jgi:hypothetical protein